MTIAPCPIVGSYDKQRFLQFSPEDAANWSMVPAPSGKKKMALYPTMGRKHIRNNEVNELQFNIEPRAIFRSINYWYSVVGDTIFRIDANYNMVPISGAGLNSHSSNVFFSFLVSGQITFSCFVDGQNLYIYLEPYKLADGTPQGDVFSVVTDTNCPPNPSFIATFGNRIVVTGYNTSQFSLSKVLLGGLGFDATTCFSPAEFAQATGIIRQFGVINNTLYIFTDYTTDIWANIPARLIPAGDKTVVTFPWKQSSTYGWDFGIADSLSLDIDFNMMVWMAQNQDGLIQIMMSRGGYPEKISTKAISVLFQKNASTGELSPFLEFNSDGFLYQYEDVIYYRLSAGFYDGNQILDEENNNNSIEFNFETKTWTRCIELNGERNRIQKHVFFNNQHLVTAQGDNTVYEMSGQYYVNEITNALQSDPQAIDAYNVEPFRYERITQIIAQDDYGEFITDFVQIDFVWGEQDFISSDSPFDNAIFVTAEDGTYITDESGNFIVAEGSNYPVPSSPTYNALFKPHIELYFSDDGGVNFFPADVREFSQLGVYSWRMRWYQLGTSRNRVYKLIAVSPAPIVVLGAIMDIRVMNDGSH